MEVQAFHGVLYARKVWRGVEPSTSKLTAPAVLGRLWDSTEGILFHVRQSDVKVAMSQETTQTSAGQKGRLTIGLLVGIALGIVVGEFSPRLWRGADDGFSAPTTVGIEDKQAEQEIRQLYDREHELLLRRDFAAQEQFYPDDFVVTNPFSMFIDKSKVMERLRADIIKYSTYERGYDYFRRYGDTAIMVGSETVVPTLDANRPDAGETIHRRFTEVWVRRDGGWQKVVRHASNITQP
jgi:ketosteroid isomerase-like protein